MHQSCESIALCFEWAGHLVPRDALPEHCRAQRTACPTNTPVGLYFFEDFIVLWTRGGGAFVQHLRLPLLPHVPPPPPKGRRFPPPLGGTDITQQ